MTNRPGMHTAAFPESLLSSQKNAPVAIPPRQGVAASIAVFLSVYGCFEHRNILRVKAFANW